MSILPRRTLTDAISLLQQYPGEAKVLAGGQSLIPLMKFRLATPGYLVDLQKVPHLDILQERYGVLVIGAMVREARMESSTLIRQRYPALMETSRVVADPAGSQLRHGWRQSGTCRPRQ